MKKIILLFLVVFSIYSCDNDSDECSGKDLKAMNPLILSSIPIIEGQELEYITNESNSFVIVANRDEELIISETPPACEEYLSIELLESGNDFSVISYLHRGNVDPQDYFQIDISPQRNNSKNGIQIQVNDDGSMEPKIWSSRPITSLMHSEIEINDLIYTDVLEISYGDIEDDENIVNIKYSKEKGVIQYETKGGLITTLNE